MSEKLLKKLFGNPIPTRSSISMDAMRKIVREEVEYDLFAKTATKSDKVTVNEILVFEKLIKDGIITANKAKNMLKEGIVDNVEPGLRVELLQFMKVIKTDLVHMGVTQEIADQFVKKWGASIFKLIDNKAAGTKAQEDEPVRYRIATGK
jgi:hypothetical protein